MKKSCLMILLLLLVSACAQQQVRVKTEAQPEDSDLLPGEVLTFLEQRPGEPRVLIRALVTRDFVRFEGQERGDFILFDRRKKTIYNVVSEDQSILVMPRQGALAQPPVDMQWHSSRQESLALPRYGADNIKAVHYRYQLNGQECHHVVAVRDFLQESTAALGEYRLALARNLAKTASAGKDAATLCHDAVFLYQPQQAFQEGFPLREWDVAGYQRFLQDAKQAVMIPRRLFELPQAYQRYSTGDMGR